MSWLGLHTLRIAADKEATEPMVPRGEAKIITSKV
jgi:hypothetical protein